MTIVKATPTITWATPADITFGTALGGAQLDATASVGGNFTYAPAAGTLLPAGGTRTLTASFAPTDDADYTDATATVTVNVDRAVPEVSVNPVELTYGTALANSQLSGTATWVVGGNDVTVPGLFSYTIAAGAVLNAGADQNESVTFTPNDSIDYSSVTTTVRASVNPVPLTITASNLSKVYGAERPVLTASYSGFVDGDTAASLAARPALTTGATAISQVSGSPYFITAAGAFDSNYTITYVTGALTVTPAPLVITVDNASTVVGQPIPAFSVSYNGFVLGQGPAS